jgi:4-carboxymuconolactone decarboxylase
MVTAFGRPQELGVYVKGALAAGVSVQEIQEVLIHATIYCGGPPPGGRRSMLRTRRVT